MNEIDKKWLEVFTANYNGTSAEAKELKLPDVIKKNYKDLDYISWATMYRLLKRIDPSCKYRIERDPFGRIAHTDVYEQNTLLNGVETHTTRFVHTLLISLDFMGKEFSDIYPIQDKGNEARQWFDQNELNKAVQRAKTRLGSMASGLGLKLYEHLDLQFEDDEKPNVEEVAKKVKKATKKVEEVKAETVNKVVETAKEVVETAKEVVVDESEPLETPLANNEPVIVESVDPVIIDVIKKVKETLPEKVLNATQSINTMLVKGHFEPIQMEDFDLEHPEKLYNKVKGLNSLENFKTAFINRLI